jgi:hypothetical protein
MTLNLLDHPQVSWPQFKWLIDQGVPPAAMVKLADTRIVRGRAVTGRLDLDPAGDAFLAFEEADDVVLWCPKSGALVSLDGHAFALGDDNIDNPITYAFDNYLMVHDGPLDWLRDGCQGVVILRWDQAFDRLRDAPRIAVTETLLPTYRRQMTPHHLPDLAVAANNHRIAA